MKFAVFLSTFDLQCLFNLFHLFVFEILFVNLFVRVTDSFDPGTVFYIFFFNGIWFVFLCQFISSSVSIVLD